MTTVLTLDTTAHAYLRCSSSVIPILPKKLVFQNWQATLVTAKDRTDTVLVGEPHRHRGLDPALVRPVGDAHVPDTAPVTGEAA